MLSEYQDRNIPHTVPFLSFLFLLDEVLSAFFLKECCETMTIPRSIECRGIGTPLSLSDGLFERLSKSETYSSRRKRRTEKDKVRTSDKMKQSGSSCKVNNTHHLSSSKRNLSPTCPASLEGIFQRLHRTETVSSASLKARSVSDGDLMSTSSKRSYRSNSSSTKKTHRSNSSTVMTPVRLFNSRTISSEKKRRKPPNLPLKQSSAPTLSLREKLLDRLYDNQTSVSSLNPATNVRSNSRGTPPLKPSNKVFDRLYQSGTQSSTMKSRRSSRNIHSPKNATPLIYDKLHVRKTTILTPPTSMEGFKNVLTNIQVRSHAEMMHTFEKLRSETSA